MPRGELGYKRPSKGLPNRSWKTCDYVTTKVIVREMRCIEHGEVATAVLTQDEIAELTRMPVYNDTPE